MIKLSPKLWWSFNQFPLSFFIIAVFCSQSLSLVALHFLEMQSYVSLWKRWTTTTIMHVSTGNFFSDYYHICLDPESWQWSTKNPSDAVGSMIKWKDIEALASKKGKHRKNPVLGCQSNKTLKFTIELTIQSHITYITYRSQSLLIFSYNMSISKQNCNDHLFYYPRIHESLFSGHFFSILMIYLDWFIQIFLLRYSKGSNQEKRWTTTHSREQDVNKINDSRGMIRKTYRQFLDCMTTNNFIFDWRLKEKWCFSQIGSHMLLKQ